MAKAYIESGIYKNILIIATEKLSTIVDYTDRNTCILFGDGACAAVVSSVGKGLLIQEVCLGSDGAHANLLAQSAGGARMPASIESVQSKLHYLRMDGKEIFKLAVTKMESAAREVLKKTGLEEHEIAWLIPHQANIRIIETLAKRFQIPMEKVYTTLHKYGNTSASSIGIALDELIQLKSIKPKEHLLLSAFGAGLTWGATVLTYE
jgi:3-oxoacyl-[acyl-carrier-protein] synthase-3